VIPRPSGGFNYYSRPDNGPDAFTWSLIDMVGGSLFQGASFILSSVNSLEPLTVTDSYGDFVVAAVTQDGTLQLFCRRGGWSSSPPGWQGPFSFGREILPGLFGNVFAGRPSLIQTSHNEIAGSSIPFQKDHYGNYDLIVPLQDGALLTSGRTMGQCRAPV